MKKFKVLIVCLMIISLVFTCISFMFMGEIIPTHIGVNGKPDAYGSKYFIVMFPIFCVLIGGVMLLVSRYAKISDNYNKYMLMTGVIIEVIFLTLNVVFVIYSLSYVEEADPFDISKVMMIIFGLLFIVLGNYMPKIEKNRTLGLKTYWSMYNEVTWQKTHRFTGFSSFIAGVLILISGILFKETVNFIILMSILLVFITSCTIASYVYYRQEKIKE